MRDHNIGLKSGKEIEDAVAENNGRAQWGLFFKRKALAILFVFYFLCYLFLARFLLF
ncbi:hypothetical protein BN137_2683 [Cronobacter condimenti 1330]|uniref:Uncharacterized protein n=2 Tax=Cronobacter condimenti TaxID=1163710 RepID=K8AGD0_9ENTR|nr:hypothetical protein BN137_2683 [Cronobacter condimenti 1330]